MQREKSKVMDEARILVVSWYVYHVGTSVMECNLDILLHLGLMCTHVKL